MQSSQYFLTAHASNLSKEQQQNILSLLKLSNRFHKLAHINSSNNNCRPDEESIILESGHQPNFLPYTGIFKKVFLLDYIVKKSVKPEKLVLFFGFADQNLSTASLLYSNHIPATNKDGFIRIGFKVGNEYKHRCFNYVPKPSQDEWNKELDTIRNFYENNFYKKFSRSTIKDCLLELTEILHKSYEYSNNFAELNAVSFAKICSDFFNFNVNFFLYSDVQKSKLFLNEWITILKNVNIYNDIYNKVIRMYTLPITPVASDQLPFWYHCECGGKVTLKIVGTHEFHGQCPVCGNIFNYRFDLDFELIKDHIHSMGTTAVSRNIIFSNGLGIRLFISGSGGSMHYGKISKEIAQNMDFVVPTTLTWITKDLYVGAVHYQALQGLKKSCNLSEKDICGNNLDTKIKNYRADLLNKIQLISDLKEHKNQKGKLINSYTQVALVKNVFNSIPSIIDIFMNINKSMILSIWERGYENAIPTIEKDLLRSYSELSYPNLIFKYSPEQVKCVIRNITNLEVNDEKNPDY